MSVLVLIFTVTGIRMASLAKNTKHVSFSSSSKTVDIATLRGTIYDCNLQPLTNAETSLYAVAKPSAYSLGQLRGKVTSDVFQSVMERMHKGKPVVVKIDSPIISNGEIKEITVPERYFSSSLACHIIGYTNNSGQGINGIEKAYDAILSANRTTVTASFSSDANGRLMLGEDIAVSGNDIPENGVVLTDVDGNRYVIKDVLQLDAKSYRKIELYL